MPSDLREAFEDWAIRNWYPVKRTPTNEYDDEETRDAYEGWLACVKHLEETLKDAARYRQLRRGQKFSIVNGIGDVLRAEELDAAVDAAIVATQGDGNEKA
jgi:hypothetical protein